MMPFRSCFPSGEMSPRIKIPLVAGMLGFLLLPLIFIKTMIQIKTNIIDAIGYCN